MNAHTLALTCAIGAGWLSFNTLVVAGYLLVYKRETLGLGERNSFWLTVAGKRDEKSAASPAILPRSQPSQKPIEERVPMDLPEQEEQFLEEPIGKPEEVPTHVFYVMFQQPSIELNQKVQLVLDKWDAYFDAELKIYVALGVTPQNPLRIANAYPPGLMPTEEVFQQEDHLLGGVSIILNKPKRKRGFDKVQLGKMVELSEELAALGGALLDEERQPASRKTFRDITGG
ncbi:hypothetical protein [Halomonas citrativorans]|uniref:Cell division protein ZipA n=1 Tax=Halomonas citrativorans TaxID=2742612 RepID=A0ABR9FFL3_9GAMM|nr:hypothetical protein [Halomonas citrativorans]MBE0404824.1 hypothetical protein [Halomonas citrativorans]